MYDFDKTLSTKDMQEYSFIPKLGLTAQEFWAQSNALAKEQKMDRILSYMYMMVRMSKDKHQPIRREDFVALGKKIQLYPGVEDWFARINAFGLEQGVRVEHYLISSGLKEIVEGCSIFDQFKEVYASEFLYDENGVAVWPKLAVNYTAKTQFLFRINKGVLDISNDLDLNRSIPDELRPVPFRNMIYIGDGLTDVPCMKLVKLNRGQSLAVYKKEKATGYSLLTDKRVDLIAPADYREGKKLDTLVKMILQKMALMSRLAAEHQKQKKQIQREEEKRGSTEGKS
ncbi:MAG TPA: haloacid dehalogenase-like hydrolase [Candidatus Egerieicola faecale]|uniref:Haloacid dehalogenase-like hydrolase n=1 Tax=Candidatus Egerieicola faecale TaxID=2840774 RepID=A0A9D1IR27_9FIRM|nr:haloacid dehalogenase-like hydrolase [Candidatus Egerieicola faecale]